MKHIDLLLPFALPPPTFAPDLVQAAQAPALAMLISRGKLRSQNQIDDFSRALPHEYWLAQRCGLTVEAQAQTSNSPPVAAALMRGFGLAPDAGFWFVLHPVHIHIARDHLMLTDVGQLALSDEEARPLFEEAQSLFREAGLKVRYGDAHTWFLRADDWRGLQTATPAAAAGRNIDLWMPKGNGERAWRKVQNDIQMQWHTHTINTVRASHGKRPINSLWLWGGAQAAPTEALTTATSIAPYDHAFNLPDWSAGLDRLCARHTADGRIEEMLATASTHLLAANDSLTEAACTEDWSAWLATLAHLERDWFAPLLAALNTGRLGRLRLVLSHNTALQEYAIHRLALHRFWRAPSLNRLLHNPEKRAS